MAQQLGLETIQIQWLLHTENITICIFVVLSTRLYTRFTIQRVYLVGCYIVLISNILAAILSVYFVGFIISLIIGAIGYGCVLPTLSPFCNIYSRPNSRGKSLILCNVLFPLGEMYGSMFSAYLTNFISYRYIFLILGGIELFHCIYLTITFKTSKFNDKNIKFDGVSIFLVALFVSSTILGLGLISIDLKIMLIISPVLVLIGLGAIVGFYVYNNYYSKYKLLPKEIFNENTGRFLGTFFLQGIPYSNEVFFQTVIWRTVFKFSSIKNGLYVGFCRIFDLIGILFINKMMQKITIRNIINSCVCIQIIVFLILALLLLTKFNINKQYPILVMDMISSLIASMQLVLTQYYNMISTPPQFGQMSSSLISFSSKYRNSIGTAFGTMVQNLFQEIWYADDRINRLSIAVVYLSNIAILIVALLISLRIGVIVSEKGKYGFETNKLYGWNTYDEIKALQIGYMGDNSVLVIPDQMNTKELIRRESIAISIDKIKLSQESIIP